MSHAANVNRKREFMTGHPEKCWRSTEKKVPVTAETVIMSAITVSTLAV